MSTASNSMLPKNTHVTLTITDFSRQGEGIGKVDGFTLFVKDSVPGDVIEAVVTKSKKRYGYAHLVQILTPSPHRVEAACPVARPCGGCQLQAVSYSQQLHWKTRMVQETLQRVGGVKATVTPIVPAPSPLRYRHKSIIPIGSDADGNPVAGYYADHSHRIVPCTECLLTPEEFGPILKEILAWMRRNKVHAYKEKDATGQIRHCFLRKSRASGEIHVCLISAVKTLPAEKDLLQHLSPVNHPEWKIAGISLCHHAGSDNVVLQGPMQSLWGRPYLEEELAVPSRELTFRYRISPKSFFQVQPAIMERMIGTVLSFAQLQGTEIVFDLYCGIGALTLFLAAEAGTVMGIETVPEAVGNARENAERNHCHNVRFVEGKVEAVLPALAQEEGVQADVVVLDPPRKGCEKEVLRSIADCAPEKIIYVSCDPATLARDLQILIEFGYEVQAVQPFDQFAMSVHVETVCLLSNRKPDTKVRIDVDLEDYYRIKDAKKNQN